MSHEDLKAAHRKLSPADWELRRAALENPEYCRRTNFPLFAKPDKVFAYRLQPWPTFISRAKIDEMAALSVGVSELMRDILRRIFDDDPAAIGRFYDVPEPALMQLLMSEPRGIDKAMSRGDFVMTADGYKCIEFNIAANLGGWETALLADMHRKTPLTSSFIEEQQLDVRYTDTLALLFKHILEDTRELYPDKDQPINIVLGLEVDDPLSSLGPLATVFGAAYRKVCVEAGASPKGMFFPCFPEQLSMASDGELKLGSQPIHAVIGLYSAASPYGPTILRSAIAGKIKLYNSPICNYLSDKRNLAMLSMMVETDLVDATERRLIEQAVPWTRTVDVPPVLQKVYAALTADELVGRREELVIKTATSFGGKDVFIGRFTDAEAWASLVEKALGSPGWVIQEYLPSVPLLYQNGEDQCSPHDVVWGPFVFGQTYAGTILRMQPQADASPVNLSLTATEGMIFEVD